MVRATRSVFGLRPARLPALSPAQPLSQSATSLRPTGGYLSAGESNPDTSPRMRLQTLPRPPRYEAPRAGYGGAGRLSGSPAGRRSGIATSSDLVIARMERQARQ